MALLRSKNLVSHHNNTQAPHTLSLSWSQLGTLDSTGVVRGKVGDILVQGETGAQILVDAELLEHFEATLTQVRTQSCFSSYLLRLVLWSKRESLHRRINMFPQNPCLQVRTVPVKVRSIPLQVSITSYFS